MEIEKLKNFLYDFRENIKFEHDLKKKNWFNIGGKSKIYYKADNLKELVNFLKKINNKEKIFVLGVGSNTLISDNLFDGIVIKLEEDYKYGSMVPLYRPPKVDINIIVEGVLKLIEMPKIKIRDDLKISHCASEYSKIFK